MPPQYYIHSIQLHKSVLPVLRWLIIQHCAFPTWYTRVNVVHQSTRGAPDYTWYTRVHVYKGLCLVEDRKDSLWDCTRNLNIHKLFLCLQLSQINILFFRDRYCLDRVRTVIHYSLVTINEHVFSNFSEFLKQTLHISSNVYNTFNPLEKEEIDDKFNVFMTHLLL